VFAHLCSLVLRSYSLFMLYNASYLDGKGYKFVYFNFKIPALSVFKFGEDAMSGFNFTNLN
jgi:hypothetical protein